MTSSQDISLSESRRWPSRGRRSSTRSNVPPQRGWRVRRRRHALVVCAVFRDEANQLTEWISFHQGVGVEKFVLYDDRSIDNFREVLAPWVADGTVEVHDRLGRTQAEVYTECARNFRRRAKWIAFIDLDEFLFSPIKQSLPKVLERYRWRAGVFAQWVLFGSSGHLTPPEGGTLRNYLYCLTPSDVPHDTYNRRGKNTGHSPRPTGRSDNGKSIIRPHRIRAMRGPHRPIVRWPFRLVDEVNAPLADNQHRHHHSVDILRVNHYWSRSLQEFERKARWRVEKSESAENDISPWLEREKELNRMMDQTILNRVVPPLG